VKNPDRYTAVKARSFGYATMTIFAHLNRWDAAEEWHSDESSPKKKLTENLYD